MPTIAKRRDRERIALAPGLAHRRSWFRLFLPLLLLLLCTGCSSDEEATDSLGISIYNSTDSGVQILASRQETLTVNGLVQESPLGKVAETACNCVGFSCFFDPQCITQHFPRVEVVVTNQTNGASVRATLTHNPNAQSETFFLWSASVSLAAGENRVVASADDGQGHRGSDELRVRNP